MLTYYQKSGGLWEDMHNISQGYSGYEEGKNSPDLEHVPNVGPIPQGLWKIGDVYDSSRVGPYTITLEPEGHDAHSRAHFRIHGDSRRNPGKASHGCIIFPRAVREWIIEQKYQYLLVLP